MIDLHTHVLPGVDDGPATISESLDMLVGSVKSGVRALAATPHVRDDYPTTAAVMEELVATLRMEAQANEIALEIMTGGEIALDRLAVTPTAELRRFGLAGNSRYLLIEFPYYGWPRCKPGQVDWSRSSTVAPLFSSHPRRSPGISAAGAGQPHSAFSSSDLRTWLQVTSTHAAGGSASPRLSRRFQTSRWRVG
jgi:protein-tyrosine phosphatase